LRPDSRRLEEHEQEVSGTGRQPREDEDGVEIETRRSRRALQTQTAHEEIARREVPPGDRVDLDAARVNGTRAPGP
jgi:hypothetical protein